MRQPFLPENSRVVVVLFRDPWGQTQWTGVEALAIQDRCLKDSFQTLFFMMLDSSSTPPAWLPATHVRFNYAEFELEQAVGAIKARVKERGGTITPLTPKRRVELFKLEQEYQRDRERLRSDTSLKVIRNQVSILFRRIEALVCDANADDIGLEFIPDNGQLSCHVRNNRTSLMVTSDYPNFGDLELVVREFDRRLAVCARGEQPIYFNGEPRETRARRFKPELNRAREYGWVEDGRPATFVTSEGLADRILIDFVDLVERNDGALQTRRLQGRF